MIHLEIHRNYIYSYFQYIQKKKIYTNNGGKNIMSRVFLSHSSADKEWYVNFVYNKLVKALGEDNVVIDNVTFQEGRRTIEEIYYQLGTTDLFVIFLSDKALASQWVQDELTKVEEILEAKKRYQICPIIIDSKVRYDDKRIPEWMKKEYNIQRIGSQTKAANVIRQRMIEIAYEKHPKLKERNQIFVGRNEFLKEFEQRMDDFDIGTPVAIVASGLEGVGRKTFLQKSLFKSNVVKDTYPFSYIVLKEDESIEDFILRIYDLGLLEKEVLDITELSSKTVGEKERILADLICDLQNTKEIIMIIDNGCIVGHEGEMVGWFKNALQYEEVKNRITLLLACKFRYFVKNYRTDRIFDVAIPELDVKERNGLLKRYLELEEIELELDQIKEISELLSGLPEQVFFAVTMIKSYGWKYFQDHTTDVVDFNSKKAVMMLHNFKDNSEKMEFLALLGSFDYISTSYVLSIVGDEKKYLSYIEEFYFNGICEYVGVLKEYIRVNDTIKDYLQRSEYKVSKEHMTQLKNNVRVFVSNIEDEDYDMPQLLYSLKVALLEGIDIDDKYIVPSIYLKSMNDLYFSGKNKEVVEFADKALLSASFMDERIIFEIRYLLCSALAKLRNQRFLTEVQQIDGADHDFLFGFYYRQIGKFDKALERINSSLEKRANFSKAKREKVQAYIGMQDYDSALELARINYENYKDNPYHIQAYFSCLIKSDNQADKKEVLQELIHNIENIGSSLAKEMTLRFRAQYAAFIEGNFDEAIALIDQAIDMNKSIHYARLVKFDIAERFDDLSTMEEIVNYFSSPELKQRYQDNIICMNAMLKAKRGDCLGAIEYFKMNIKNYTDAAKDRFEVRLNKYAKTN